MLQAFTEIARSIALRALFTCLLVACQQTASERLNGKWIGTEVELFSGEVSATAEAWARGTILQFSDSELTVTVPGQPARSGEYSVVHDKDGRVVLEVRGHHGHRQETRLTLETERLMRWHISDRQTVVLERM